MPNAMISQPANKLVTFTGERMEARITVRELILALESALVWLRGREPESTVEAWDVVKIKMGIRLIITFRSDQANGEISNRLHNLHELQKKRKPRVLPRLTDEDIEGTKELASIIGEDFTSVKISSPGEPTVNVTPTLVERVAEIAKVARGHYHEWGTLRGMMDQITVGAKTKFRIQHVLTGAEINCTFDPLLLEQVKAALPARVEVYGKMRRNRSDQPTSIDVMTFRVLAEHFTPFNETPAVDITSGVESTEYVERLRNGG